MSKRRSSLADKYSSRIGSIDSSGSGEVKVSILSGKAIQEVRVDKELMACDVFVNTAIIKDHTMIQIIASEKSGIIFKGTGHAEKIFCNMVHSSSYRVLGISLLQAAGY